jgi:hypothetical protein
LAEHLFLQRQPSSMLILLEQRRRAVKWYLEELELVIVHSIGLIHVAIQGLCYGLEGALLIKL